MDEEKPTAIECLLGPGFIVLMCLCGTSLLVYILSSNINFDVFYLHVNLT